MGLDDDAVAFAEELGRFWARSYGLPPVNGSVVGWMLVCEPPQQTAAELSERLGASRSAIGGAITSLEALGFIRRLRVAGERAERIVLNPEYWERSLEGHEEYIELGRLLRRGLEVLGETTPSRRARLLEAAAFTRFVRERMPALAAEWRAHRDALRASGELPELD